jgi:rubrerythrin
LREYAAPKEGPACASANKTENEKEHERLEGMIMKWVCDVCGYEFEGDTAPEECPVCGLDSSHFEQQE